ncbi:MAG: hypothetical protein ABSG81_06550 [Acidimicrobiales bacterium]
MIERRNDAGGAHPHGVRLWQWLVFDPPMRDPLSRGCRIRHVSCTACRCALGSTDDPLDAVLLAWRHRRQSRHGPAFGATSG